MRRLNPLPWIVNFFRKNAFFNVLRLTSKLLFLTLFFGYFRFLEPLGFGFSEGEVYLGAYFSMVVLDVLLFEILRLKESDFKDTRAFFKKNRFSPQRIDRHTRFMTRMKAASCILIPLIITFIESPIKMGAVFIFFIYFLPIFSTHSYASKVAKKSPFIKGLNSWADKHIQPCHPKITDGLLGYDSAGIPTMSRTAVGGSSS